MTLFLRVPLLEEIPVYIPYDPRPKLSVWELLMK
jgi:hypothetical protein